MHTPVKVLIERFCEESGSVQDKYGHLLDIIGNTAQLDEELFRTKRDDYAVQLRDDLAELAEKYKKLAKRDSQTDQERLSEELVKLAEEQCVAFVARYPSKHPEKA